MKVVDLAYRTYLKQFPMIIVLASLVLHSLFNLRVILNELSEHLIIKSTDCALALASDTRRPFGII
jgi:hypothetical protein